MELVQQKGVKMSEDVKLICADCGKEFMAVLENDTYTPSECPSCNMAIDKVDKSPTSNEEVATGE